MATTKVRIYLVIVLGIVFGYNVLTLFMEVSSSREPKSDLKRVERPWNITSKELRYSYPIAMEMNERKWYRVGFLISSNVSAEVDMALISLSGDEQLIGTLTSSVGVSEEYQERVFLTSIPASTEMRFSLSNKKGGMPKNGGIEISSVTITELDVASDAILPSLSQTRLGTFATFLRGVTLERKWGVKKNVYRGEFVAQDDFVESVDLKSFLKETGSFGGLIEIHRKACSTCEDMDTILWREPVSPREVLRKYQKKKSDVVNFPVFLRRGERYEVVFYETYEHWYSYLKRVFDILQIVPNSHQLLITLVTGRPSDSQERFLLRGARIEDLGRRIKYSYHSDGSIYDYLNLWRTEGKVWFDEKARQVVGQQKIGTNFTYKFSVGGPFLSFSFSAVQRESSEQEVILEYSLDGVLWHEVSFLPDSGKGLFRFLLSGKDDQDTVYVRASYHGENKKTRKFGLEQVLVTALLK